MGMVTLTPFKADDLLLIKSEEAYPGWEMALALEKRGPAFTAWVGNEAIACCGIAKLWKGVGEAWTYLSPAAKHRKLELTRSCKKFIREIADGLGLWRVQSYAKDNESNINWHGVLGFYWEATLMRYFPDGTSAQVMVWLRDEQ